MKYKTVGEENVLQTPAPDPTNAENQTEILKFKECRLSERMSELMVRQLVHELYNANLYRSFANFYGTLGYVVLEKYYIERAEEEKKHHDWIHSWISYNDVPFKYPTIPAIEEKWKDMVKPFEITVEAEVKTTTMIDEMLQQAIAEGDWGTFGWIMGNGPIDGRLRPEQSEEENVSRTALDIARGEGSWYRKEKSIYAMYEGDLD